MIPNLPPSKNFYFSTIISLINEKKSPYSMCSKKISKQKINYYINILKENNIINKVGYGVWEIIGDFNKLLKSKKGKKNLRYGVSTNPQKVPKGKKIIRGHGFRFTVKIPTIPRWNQRHIFLEKKNIPYKTIPQGQRIILKNFKIWLCKDSLVIIFPTNLSFIGESAEQTEFTAIKNLKAILIKLENLFSINLKINKSWQFRVSNHHFSYIRNELAIMYNQEKKKMQCYDDKGKLWLLIDNSFNLHETETINKETAVADMDNIVKPFFNNLRDNAGNIPLPYDHWLVTQSLLQNWHMYSENIKSHVEAINTMKTEIAKLTKIMSKLEKKT
jgi:SUMO ligase MMS21 Smc5/6 complex component